MNKAVGSLKSRVLVTVGKFKELGACCGEDIEFLEGIDRMLQATLIDLHGNDQGNIKLLSNEKSKDRVISYLLEI